MAINYINIFQSKALQKISILGFLVWKQTIWQPWSHLCYVKKIIWEQRCRMPTKFWRLEAPSSTYINTSSCIPQTFWKNSSTSNKQLTKSINAGNQSEHRWFMTTGRIKLKGAKSQHFRFDNFNISSRAYVVGHACNSAKGRQGFRGVWRYLGVRPQGAWASCDRTCLALGTGHATLRGRSSAEVSLAYKWQLKLKIAGSSPTVPRFSVGISPRKCSRIRIRGH
jgi:hypothetical protein